jgi:hypothetical protein
VLSLLAGLLFRPRLTLEKLIREPNRELSSRLTSFLVILTMINTAFLVNFDPNLAEKLAPLGSVGKWIFVLVVPPIAFFVQRFLMLLYVRIGLALFASKQMPKDPVERRARFARVKEIYPYTVAPMIIFALISFPIENGMLNLWLSLLGLFYMFYLSTQTLRTLYQVSTGVALLGPLFVQFIFSIAIFVVILIIVFLGQLVLSL